MSEKTQRGNGFETIRDSPGAASASGDRRQLYEFGPFCLDPAERQLLRGNQIVPLTLKAFDTLLLLVRNSGHLLEKDELIRMLWPDTFVGEGSLTNNIFLLRKALGEDPAFIETVPRRGYRFVGAVRPLGETIDSVAVLPFVNTSDDPNTEYLSDGITETLISSLTQLRGLRVMARGTVFRFKGQDVDPQKIGRDLQVRAVLTGRLLQRGDTLTFQTELIDVAKGSRLWGAHYDRKLAHVLGVQEDIAQEISQNLRLRLTGEDQKRLATSATANSEAYQDYLKGRYWWNKATEQGFDKGIEFFRRAIAKDPTYAHAYSGLADCYSSLAGNGFISAKDGYLKAKDAALKALELDDTLAEAHTSLALIKTSYDWDWSGAAREFKRAIALNPSYAEAHQFYAQALWQMGRVDEAIAESRLTLEFDPLSLGANVDLGVAFFLARQYDRAIEQQGKVLELDPGLVDAYYFQGVAHIKKSMYVEAMAELEKGVAIAPDSLVALTGVGYGYAVTGKKSEAQQVLDKLSALSTQKYVSPVWMAKVYTGLEDKDKAFEWLEEAYEDRSIVSVGYVKTNPMFDPLRSDPRYSDLLRRTYLSP